MSKESLQNVRELWYLGAEGDFQERINLEGVLPQGRGSDLAADGVVVAQWMVEEFVGLLGQGQKQPRPVGTGEPQLAVGRGCWGS